MFPFALHLLLEFSYLMQIGGGNLYDKAAAVHFLVSRCDGLVFVGMMSFQIMHALGLSVPSYLVEPGAYKAALDIIQIAHDRNIPILHPMDFWCMNEHLPEKMGIFPSHHILDGEILPTIITFFGFMYVLPFNDLISKLVNLYLVM